MKNAIRSIPKKIRLTALLLFLLLAGASAFLFFQERAAAKEELRSVERDVPGGTVRDVELIATAEGKDYPVTLSVPPASLTEEERDAVFSEAYRRFSEEILPEMLRAGLRADLALPDSLPGLPVSIEYLSSAPSLLGHDGTLGSDIPEAGADVTLTVFLSVEEEIREYVFPVRVLPRSSLSSSALAETAEKAVREADPSSGEVPLPDSFSGKALTWRKAKDGSGIFLLLLAFVLPLFLLVRSGMQEKEKKEKEIRLLMLDYAGIVDKLVLLLSAGMSLRRAVSRIALDYRRERDRTGRRPGFEEILTIHYEMNRGISEADAIRHLGDRALCPAYRTLSSLMLRSLTSGGAALLSLMRQEAAEAGRERLKTARIRGEEAGTKLLFPMLLMLCVVLTTLMVPAFLSFMQT